MAEARVESIDALKSLKTAMIKFAEGANAALGDSESEVMRVMNWLENEQTSYWQMQHRKRTELVGRCKEQLRMKTIFKDSSGRQQSAVEEQKAAKGRLAKTGGSRVQDHCDPQSDQTPGEGVPALSRHRAALRNRRGRRSTGGGAHLENLLTSLEAYAGLAVPVDVTSTAASEPNAPMGGERIGSMARPVDEKKEEDSPQAKSADAGSDPPTPGADAS